MTDKRQIFIAWFPYQRRQVSMSHFFNFALCFMPHRSANRFFRPFHYAGHALKTLHLLRRGRPHIVWVQLPPSPLLTVAILYRYLFDRTVRIIGDCHNSMFVPPWCKWPGVVSQLNSIDAVLVHNDAIVRRAIGLGIHKDRVHVLEDPPALFQTIDAGAVSYPRPWVLFLTAFASDEPIAELYSAAALAPDLRFVVAGDQRRARGRHRLRPHPPNVVLAGYLHGALLDAAIGGADAVLGLTKHADEQLSAAAEAVGAGKAMILADTPVLRDMYPSGATYVKVNEPASIAQGCRYAVAHRIRLEKESVELRRERWIRWRRGASALASVLKLSRSQWPAV
jgi:hypothetical protein